MVLRSQVRTADGGFIGLRRLAPTGPPGPPVLLIPGFGNTGHLYTIRNHGPSWLETLSAAGLDPWAVDMRQHVGFQDWLHLDLPAAVNCILRVTGYARIHVVGCSLGGLLAYTWLGHDPDAPVDRLVAIGTPLTWHEAPAAIRAFRVVGGLLGGHSPGGSRFLARRALPLLQRIGAGPFGFYLHPDRLEPAAALSLPRAVVDPGPALVRAVHRWVKDGEPRLGDGPLIPHLARVRTPLLLVTGDGDRIAPERCCTPVLSAWGGPTAHHRTQGDWGHVDLFISKGHQQQVLGPLLDWLQGERRTALPA
jgi:pimeloyl-ACP methyl ester carboxylesterase